MLCWLLGHRWRVHHLVTVEEYPMHHGYAVHECARCGKTRMTP